MESTNRRVIGNKDETKSLNQYPDALQANIFEFQRETWLSVGIYNMSRRLIRVLAVR